MKFPLLISVATAVLLSLPVYAVELSGTWLGNDGQTYTLQQQGRAVTITGRQERIKAELTEDQYFVQSDKLKFQWVDDDTLVLKKGDLGKLTKLRRQ